MSRKFFTSFSSTNAPSKSLCSRGTWEGSQILCHLSTGCVGELCFKYLLLDLLPSCLQVPALGTHAILSSGQLTGSHSTEVPFCFSDHPPWPTRGLLGTQHFHYTPDPRRAGLKEVMELRSNKTVCLNPGQQQPRLAPLPGLSNHPDCLRAGEEMTLLRTDGRTTFYSRGAC